MQIQQIKQFLFVESSFQAAVNAPRTLTTYGN